MLQQYENHEPDFGDGEIRLDEAKCFVCGRDWPCELTLAYNDGIRDGQIMATQAGYESQ